jgi:hypothetical protein
VKKGGSERIEWVFDPLPASGARRGGDPASHVFRQSVSSFVREVVQNANDQRIENESAEIHFRFVELRGPALEEFRRAVAWETLAPHLREAAKTTGGRNLKEFLAEHEKRDRLVLLVIEDRNTVGLTGDERDGESHFRALCKDTLFSHKQTDSAGGSYGLGKSILWAFSGLSTVLFNSVLSDGSASPRLFGRAELPSHAAYAGSGWFGRVIESGPVAYAESVWAMPAAERASRLKLARPDASGTSISILGFRDPASDADRSIVDLEQEIRAAVVREFWPAMVMPGAPLQVWVAPRPLLPERDFAAVRPFIEAYRGRISERAILEEPGQVVVKELEVELPARRDGKQAERALVRLCVRLADEATHDKLAGHIAWFRGAGMVVWYKDRSNLALGARPFHAVVACGEARNPDAPTAGDRALERFLRSAEPPGHDVWESTATLKAEYRAGYAKALEQLKRRVEDELKAIVVAQPRHGKQGPDRLRKRFPLGTKGGKGSGPSAFSFQAIDAHIDGDRWHFRAEVRPAAARSAAWRCDLRIAEIGEDGLEIRTIPVETVRASHGVVRIEDGVASIDVTGKVLKLDGTSVPVAHDPRQRRAIHLELRGVERG